MVFYFGYGSNLSLDCMRERAGFNSYQPGVLKGFELKFNKQADRHPLEGMANVEPCEGARVEGVVYDLAWESLERLDKSEHLHECYERRELPVELRDGSIVVAWVYVARKEHVKDGLKPSREYLGLLLQGENLVTDSYYSFLSKVKTLEY